MKKLLLLLFFPFSLFAQSSWNVWVDNCGAPGANVPVKMIKTQDEGIAVLLLCSQVVEDSVTLLMPVLKKYDLDGELLWEKEYAHWVVNSDTTFQTGLWAQELLQLPDGTFFIYGRTRRIFFGDNFLLKVSEEGDSLFLKEYADYGFGKFLSKNDNVYFIGFDQINDYRFIGHFNLMAEGLVEDVDIDTFFVHKFIIDNQGNFITSAGLPNSQQSWYNKFSPMGEILIEKNYEEGIGFHLTISSDDFPVAYADDVAKFDEDLDIMWRTEYEELEFAPNVGVDQKGWDIKTTADGGFILGGHFGSISLGVNYYKVFLIKLDDEGVIEWGYGYGMPVNILFDVVEMDDGYIFLAAEEADGDIWLVKVDEEGVFTSTEEVPQLDLTTIHLYPNPCQDILNIQAFKNLNGVIQIFDLSGRQWKCFEIRQSNQKVIEVVDLEPGFYFLRYVEENSQRMITVKFIKQ